MKAKEPEYFGTCSNCGHSFHEHGVHGPGCGCGYALSAHEKECWGKDGQTPHPKNAQYGKPRPGDAQRGKPRAARRIKPQEAPAL